MKSLILLCSGALLTLIVGCGVESADTATESQASTGIANPAAVHCEARGHHLEGDQCVFADGTSCEQWAFFRGECSPVPAGPDAGPDAAPSPDGGPAPSPSCTPLPGAGGAGGGVGLANPAAVYCTDLGYDVVDGRCAFPDGTSCEPWAFWRGECGEAHSFCARQGGTVAATSQDVGGWTAIVAVCTLPSGATCNEQSFAQSCVCE